METKQLSSAQLVKREQVEALKEKIQKAESFVVLSYKGITVSQDNEFRSEFRKNNIEYKVIKNTLMRMALNELGYTEFDEALNGTSSFAFSFEDAVLPSKLSAEGAKKFKSVEIKCGMIDKKFADAAVIDQMSKVPGREQLLTMLAQVLIAPVRGLAVALNAVAEKGEA